MESGGEAVTGAHRTLVRIQRNLPGEGRFRFFVPYPAVPFSPDSFERNAKCIHQ